MDRTGGRLSDRVSILLPLSTVYWERELAFEELAREQPLASSHTEERGMVMRSWVVRRVTNTVYWEASKDARGKLVAKHW